MKHLIFIFFSSYAVYLNGQLLEFTTTVLATPETSVVQANSNYPNNALVLIYSDLNGLQFRSSMGAINKQAYNTAAQRYEVLCDPIKQMIFVAKNGYIEKRLATINPKPKDVIYFKVEKAVVASGDRGILSIVSDPPQSRIILNDLELAERTPFLQKLPTGTHRVVLQKERYLELDTVLQIHKDQERTLNVKLTPNWANLSVRVAPETGEISINDKTKGRGYFEASGPEAGLNPGNYLLNVQLEKYYPFETQLKLSPGTDSVLNVKLKPITGHLVINSEPPGATVHIDGQKAGKTPFREQYQIGKYFIEVKKGRQLRAEKSIVVKENSESEATLRLKNIDKSNAQNELSKLELKAFREDNKLAIIASRGLVVIGLGGFGLGGYFLGSSIVDYNKYQSATSEAERLRERVLAARSVYPIAFAAGGTALIGSILFNNKLQKKKREWSLTAIPTNGGVAVGYASNF